MGNTFRFPAGGVNAVERAFGDERAPALCRPPAGQAFARAAPSDTMFGGDAAFNKRRWIVHDVAYGFCDARAGRAAFGDRLRQFGRKLRRTDWTQRHWR